MKDNKSRSKGLNTTSKPSTELATQPRPCLVLHLYIAGLSPRSTLAVERIRVICDRHLKGFYELTVIDLYLHPELARQEQIIVAPTLVKQSPIPKRMFIGDMADEKKILLGLNLVI